MNKEKNENLIKLRPNLSNPVCIEELNNLILNCALIYDDAREFWKKHFEGKSEVKFDSFAKSLFEDLHVNMDKEGTKYKCLEAMMCNDGLINLDRFGLILKWFGHLKVHGSNIIENIEMVLNNKWFHGAVSRQELVEFSAIFGKEKKKKQFLVRFSETEPIEEHPFSLTLWNGEKSTSYRINYEESKGEYSCSFKDKKDQNVEIKESLLNRLIKNLMKPIGLKTEIPGKYTYIFHKEEVAEKKYKNEGLNEKN